MYVLCSVQYCDTHKIIYIYIIFILYHLAGRVVLTEPSGKN